MTPAYQTAGTLVFYGATALSVVAVLGTACAACAAVQAIRRRSRARASAVDAARVMREVEYLNELYAMESAGEP